MTGFDGKSTKIRQTEISQSRKKLRKENKCQLIFPQTRFSVRLGGAGINNSR